MYSRYLSIQKGHGLTWAHFKPLKSEEILFQMDIAGKSYAGHSVPPGF